MAVYSNIPGSGGKTIPIDLIWEGENIKCEKCNIVWLQPKQDYTA